MSRKLIQGLMGNNFKVKIKLEAMDNKRVYRSYREKVKEQASPYMKPGHGLLSRFKRLFSPKNSEKAQKNSSAEKPTGEEGASKIEGEISRAGEQSSFINNSALDSERSPNEILKQFFLRKKDSGLSDVEYEGVISLMNKSRMSANNSVISQSTERVVPSRQPLQFADVSLQSRRKGPYDTFLSKNDSTVLSNPGNQERSLIKGPETLFSGYGAMQTPNNSFSRKSLPPMKRVYQFSGLPSPYRTKIRPPSLRLQQGFQKPSNPVSSIEPPSKKSLPQPMSNAANSLLSILDGNSIEEKPKRNDTSGGELSKDLSQFGNPYSKSRNLKKHKSQTSSAQTQTEGTKKKGHTVLTADDIKNTVYFNRAQDLDEKEDDSNSAPNGKDSTKDPFISNSQENTKDVNNKRIKDHENQDAKIHKDPVSTFTFNPVSNGTAFESKKPLSTKFNFGETQSPQLDRNPEQASLEDDFSFPKLELVQVELDQQKVNQYMDLFTF